MRVLTFLSLLLLLLASACGGSRQSGICGDINPKPTAQGDAAAAAAEGDQAFAQRSDEAMLRKAIAAYKKSLAIDPNQPDLRVKLARAHYFLADGHLLFDEEKKEEMLSHYKEGTNVAEFALGQKYPAFRSKFCARQPFDKALQQLDKGAVGAIYWYATNLGKYALATSIVQVLNQKDRIKGMMELVKKLEPAYFNHAADRYFGAFYTKIPFPNGDLPRSRSHFEASIKGSPSYLSTRVLFAEMYALKAKDKALFEEQLNYVVNFDTSSNPDFAPENEAEKKKAKNLLEELEVYFPEE